MNEIFDSIIIGSGIAGMTSAIYLKRYNLNCLIIEKNVPGGQISKASIVENYPGFVKIDGATLATNLYEQITNLDIPLLYEDVIEIKEEQDYKIVKTNNNEYKTKTVVIATGRSPRKLNLGEEKLVGSGISYCATCDGMFYKDKEVVVVGGGNSALEESLYLAKICKKVTILNRSQTLKADKILEEQIKNYDNIELLMNKEIKEINKNDDKVSSVTLNDNIIINCEGIFVYIGLNPNANFLENIEKENGYIIVDQNQQTNIKGIYAVGDVTKKELYQLITAASEGAIAASQIKKI